ncbi:MAG: TAXI family TRAP transporter solute-binding subunit [Betaproteobacteria bacterium]|nr:TAXI family TRAP transporter solute-binding subunit [Betaproteobacteria bacterium]
MKKLALIAGLLTAALLPLTAAAQTKISIATGGTGGVYYPLGGGIANVLSKHVPGMQATAEVTGASVENMKLVGGGKADVGFTMADTAWDAFKGLDKFKDSAQPVRALAVFYPNHMQVVTVEGRGIDKLADLKGKRISTGSPGSGTEVMAFRLLEAMGLDKDKDVKRERLSIAESVNAMKDGKIDALIWVGGVPTPALTDLAATPNTKIKLIDHGEALDKMKEKYGPLYVKTKILANSYPGQTKDSENIAVWNILVVNEKADEKVVYDIVKTMFEKKAEIVAVHKDAAALELSTQMAGGSPIPFHPGALKYFREKGLKVN